MFLETSALTGENVEEAFLKCSRTILSKIETGMPLIDEFLPHFGPRGSVKVCIYELWGLSGVHQCRKLSWFP